MAKNDKTEFKRRGFLSLLSIALIAPKPSKASGLKSSAKKVPELYGKLVLPEGPVAFQSIVVIEGGRLQRLFSKKLVDPGKNRILGKQGPVSTRDIFKLSTGTKVYLQYTGADMGWVVLS